MNPRTERILFAIGFMFAGAVLALLILLVAASTADAATANTTSYSSELSAPSGRAAATCTPTSWQARTNIHGVRCTLGRCTGTLSVCGTWGCASTTISGSSLTVYEGRALWVQVTRTKTCRYRITR